MLAVAMLAAHPALHLHSQVTPAKPVTGLRMYVFELGNLPLTDGNFFTPPIKIASGDCCIITGHLIAHPKGTLMWDTGTTPDHLIGTKAEGTQWYTGAPLRAKLADIGYRPEEVTYVGFSHYHFDHTANANLFKNSTWIVQEAERAAMFGASKPHGMSPPVLSHYNELKNAKTIVLSNVDDFDVFGDGTVVIKPAPGHTPGQQMLVLNFPKRGRVMVAGDLYHLPQERAAAAVPLQLEWDAAISRASRTRMEDYVKRHNIPMWLVHDSRLYATLPKSPAYIE
jgi:glyoxylase-like metal-dependent hydrolase (beta-lactamase superfamily II)